MFDILTVDDVYITREESHLSFFMNSQQKLVNKLQLSIIPLKQFAISFGLMLNPPLIITHLSGEFNEKPLYQITFLTKLR